MKVLLKNDLKKILAKIYPKDFAGLLVQAKKYAWIEEDFMLEEDPPASTLGGGGESKNANSPRSMEGESDLALDPVGRRTCSKTTDPRWLAKHHQWKDSTPTLY